MYHAAFVRSAIALAALLSTASVLAASASNGYPTRPIRFVIAQTPGSSIDAMGRVIATKMSELLGQQLWWTTAPAPAAPSARASSPTPSPTATLCSPLPPPPR